MTHHAAPSFWRCYEALPEPVRTLADKQFQLLKTDPRHPSLQFKRVARFHSVRVGAHYRALAVDVSRPGGAPQLTRDPLDGHTTIDYEDQRRLACQASDAKEPHRRSTHELACGTCEALWVQAHSAQTRGRASSLETSRGEFREVAV